MALSAAIWIALFGGKPRPAGATAPPPDPDAGLFPLLRGAEAIRLGGEIEVDGRPMETSIFHTDATPAEVIQTHLEFFETRAVDLSLQPLEEGLALSILDTPNDRRLLVVAREGREGGAEVIRSWSPLLAPEDPPAPELPPLPEGALVVSRIHDRVGAGSVSTYSLSSEDDPAQLEEALHANLEEDGWVVGETSREEPRRLRRGADEAWLSLGAKEGGGSFALLRVQTTRD